MNKLPFLILLLALSSLNLSACTEKDASNKQSAAAETTPAEIVQATAPVAAAAGAKKAADGGEPDCN